MKWIHIAAVLAVGVSTGCLTTNGHELPKVTLGESTGKPTAVIALVNGGIEKTMNGSHTDLGANFNEGLVARTTTSMVARYWKIKKLIRDFDWPGKLDEPATHRLTVSGTVDEAGSLSGAFITGLTFYIIPSTATMEYDLVVQLERLSDGATYTVDVKNSFELIQQIFLLPVTPLGSLVWGSYGAAADRALYLYSEFSKQGAFDGYEVRSASH